MFKLTGVEFNGRLGNQLFQLAFFRYLRERDTRNWYFFSNPHHSYFSRYFRVGQRESILSDSGVFSFIPRVLTKIIKFNGIYIQNIQIPKHVTPRTKTIYKGFFQTDWYLDNTSKKFELKVREKYLKKFNDLYGDIFQREKTLAVHIRRTDYLNYGKRDISLPIEYFKRRLSEIQNIEEYTIFFLSDDIDYVRQHFPDAPNRIFSNNSEIVDFQIIMNCDIAIISNSSFSWWAAYLNKKQAKVYAPKNWLAFRIGKEHPKGIMTKKFIWCEVL